MQRHLKDIRQVAHYWANKVQESGEAGALSFNGAVLKSYAEPIAKHTPDGAVLLTTQGHSVTTAKHIGMAQHAIPFGVEVHHVHNVQGSVAENLAVAQRDLDSILDRALSRKQKKWAEKDLVSASILVESFNRYSRGNGGTAKQLLKLDVKVEDLPRLAEMRMRQEAARRGMETRRRKAELAAEQEDRAKWRTHGSHRHFNNPVMLRLDYTRTMVETSAGAEIPVDDALRLWPLIVGVRVRGKDFTVPHGYPIGVYNLSKVEADGSIVVGCHKIAYDEIKLIADQLGLDTSSPEPTTQQEQHA